MQCLFRFALTGNGNPNLNACGQSLIYLIPGKLAFVSGNASEIQALKDSLKSFDVKYISSDLHRKYIPFAFDFGPVNLGIIHRFCQAFEKRLTNSSSLIVYCFEPMSAYRANACLLLAAFMMLNKGWSLDQASSFFGCSKLPFPLVPFRDATYSPANFGLTLKDCLAGLARASELGWYKHKAFDLASYESLDDPRAGDIHQICPKFVAFKGPLCIGSPFRQNHEVAFPPSKYIPELSALGVTCVVRLNEAETYDG